MPDGHEWRVNWYSCTRRNKDGDINSLLEKHKENNEWRIASPLPKNRPLPWDSADAGLRLRGQQRTSLFQGHTGAFVVTQGPFHAQCTVSTGRSPKEIRNPGPEILAHELTMVFYSSPIQYD